MPTPLTTGCSVAYMLETALHAQHGVYPGRASFHRLPVRLQIRLHGQDVRVRCAVGGSIV